jgi:hypothetical protein
VAGSCECGNEPSGSINAGNFVTSLGPVSFSGRSLRYGVSCFFSAKVVTRTRRDVASNVHGLSHNSYTLRSLRFSQQ